MDLILRGEKTLEIRTWPTKYRGELWLHAGIKLDTAALQYYGIKSDDLVRGALLGRAVLTDCRELDASTWESLRPQHLNIGPFESPKFAWVLDAVERIEPRPMRGQLGLMRIADAEGVSL